MSKDIETLKDRIVACIDEKDKPYVISLLSDFENTIHEHSFDNGYDFGWCVGMMMGSRND